MTRILYSGTRNASSWAFRAWLALREAGVSFEERVVDIRRPQRFENLAFIGTFSPPAAVPVLVDDGHVISDSLAIMEYANDLADGVLLPRDMVSRAQARALMAWQHGGLSRLCERLSFESAFYPARRAMTEQEEAESARVFSALEESLQRHGGAWLAGDFSLADIAFVPTMIRIGAHASDLERWPRMQAWMHRLLDRPAVLEWMREAHALPPVFLDDYAP